MERRTLLTEVGSVFTGACCCLAVSVAILAQGPRCMQTCPSRALAHTAPETFTAMALRSLVLLSTVAAALGADLATPTCENLGGCADPARVDGDEASLLQVREVGSERGPPARACARGAGEGGARDEARRRERGL